MKKLMYSSIEFARRLLNTFQVESVTVAYVVEGGLPCLDSVSGSALHLACASNPTTIFTKDKSGVTRYIPPKYISRGTTRSSIRLCCG